MSVLLTPGGAVKCQALVFSADGAGLGLVEKLDEPGKRFRLTSGAWIGAGSVAAAYSRYIVLGLKRYQVASASQPPGRPVVKVSG